MDLVSSTRQAIASVKGWIGSPFSLGWGVSVPPSYPISWWQQGLKINTNNGANAAVEAAVSAISQTVACLPIIHYKKRSDGSDEIVKNSRYTALMRRPNAYQTRADLILNLVRQELLAGNGIAIAIRDQNDNIIELHNAPYIGSAPGIFISEDDGSIYYNISPHTLLPDSPVETPYMWRGRDILHIRMHTPRHPLIGETPIVAAALAIATGNAISAHNATFFGNMSRPSGVLTTPKILKKEAVAKLKEDWEANFSKGSSGRTAVLMEDLKWQPLALNSVDAELINVYKLSVADVARVFRVPLSIIGEMGGSTYNNTEVLINTWLSTGLSYVLEHIEIALDKLFNFGEDEFMAFDVDYLLRTDFVSRVDGLTRAIQGGLLSPNEARAREGLSPVKAGEEPRLQAQVVPLSTATIIPSAPSAPVPSTPTKPTKSEDREVTAVSVPAAKTVQQYLDMLKKAA